MILVYLILVIVLAINSYKEMKFTQRRMGHARNLLWLIAISNSIYAFGLLSHILFTLFELFGIKSLIDLQCQSCMNETAGFGVLTFFLHFFGQLLPLSAIFALQLNTRRMINPMN